MLTWAQIAIGILHSGIAHERQPNFRHRKKKRGHFKTPPRLRQADSYNLTVIFDWLWPRAALSISHFPCRPQGSCTLEEKKQLANARYPGCAKKELGNGILTPAIPL